MLNPGHGGHWVSRRDTRIRLATVEAVLTSNDGLPYLAPQLQLHFKARDARDRDNADFEQVLSALSSEARAWLARWLDRSYGDHVWAGRLRA